jgi:hypothetical protein
MNHLEKFGLVSGIIGLVADIIGLVSFLSGIWKPSAENLGTGEMPFIFLVIFAFTIIYGWFSISWVLIRKAYLARKYNKKSFISASFKTAFAVGIMVFPLIIAWWVVIVRTDESRQYVEIQNRKAAEATQSALITPVPTEASGNQQVTPTPSLYGNPNDRVDKSGWYCLTIPAHVALTVGMFLVIILIMPNVYSDMPEVTMDDLM